MGMDVHAEALLSLVPSLLSCLRGSSAGCGDHRAAAAIDAFLGWSATSSTAVADEARGVALAIAAAAVGYDQVERQAVPLE